MEVGVKEYATDLTNIEAYCLSYHWSIKKGWYN